jgi:hypothetical protein
MTAMRAIEVDETTAAALEKSAAEQGVSVADLLAELAGVLSPDDAAVSKQDWSIALERLAEYDRTGVSCGVDEVFAEFHEQLEAALAVRK